MPIYIYKAKKSNAESVTGQISAQNQEEAVELIHQLGLLPVSVVPQPLAGKKASLNKPQKIKLKELYLFSRQLSNLLKSGVSLSRALLILEDQSANPYFTMVIANISDGIKNGKSFSESLTAFPHIFSPLFITMVRAGEESSNLQGMLVSIAQYQKEQGEILSKVRSAIAYPIFMLGMGMITIYFILTYVLPKMSSLFTNMGDQLPFATKVLINLSRWMHEGWAWVGLIFFCGTLLAIRWAQSPSGKKSLSQSILHVPLFGDIVLKVELARFSRTMLLLLHSGVPVTRALNISIPILSNESIKQHLSKCHDDLTAGGSFGESLRESEYIPQIMGHLINIGEETGSLDEVFNEIATTYEQETTEAIKTMTTLLEPVMILFIGGLIGFIVFAMLLPIFQMDILAR